MNALLSLSRGIDWLNDRFAYVAKWAVFASCFISAANAIVRYGFNYSSNAYLEIQWYLFTACVMPSCERLPHTRYLRTYGGQFTTSSVARG